MSVSPLMLLPLLACSAFAAPYFTPRDLGVVEVIGGLLGNRYGGDNYEGINIDGHHISFGRNSNGDIYGDGGGRRGGYFVGPRFRPYIYDGFPRTVDYTRENYVRQYPTVATEVGTRDRVTVRPSYVASPCSIFYTTYFPYNVCSRRAV